MDNRAHIKIEFQIFNSKLETCEMSINYLPDSCGVDPRVSAWFEEKYDLAKIQFDYDCNKEQRELDARKLEEQERREFERLKAKYETNNAQ